jgi:CBS-domain-containing membrane protein
MNVAFFLTPKRDVVWVPTSASVSEAIRLMRAGRYAAVQLLDEDGRYAGTLTEGDLLWHVVRPSLQTQQLTLEASVLTVRRRTNVRAVRIDVQVEVLVSRSIEQNFVPVTDDRDVFIGIVPRRPLIEHCARLAGLRS